MLVGSDMVLLQIGEDTIIKHKALGSVKHQCLGRNLHSHRIQSGLHHTCKILLQYIGFRCGVLCMNMFLPDDNLYGTYQPHLSACILQNRFHQISGGGFSLGTGNTDYLQFFCRMAKPCRRNKCHGISGIFHTNHRNIL